MDSKNDDEIKRTIQKVSQDGHKLIALQIPDGLKPETTRIVDLLKKKNISAVIVAPATFGACDLADELAKQLGATALIHLGHNKFYTEEKAIEGTIPVYYVPWSSARSVLPTVRKFAKEITEKKVTVVTTAQHLHERKKVEDILQKEGKTIIQPKKGVRTQTIGQILGCDSTTAQQVADLVDAFVYVGSGRFHPLKLCDSGKKVYKIDPLEQNMTVVNPNDRLSEKKRETMKVLKYAEEKRWGILISKKAGQNFPVIAASTKKYLEQLGKEVYLFVGDRIFESDLIGFGIKIFVNTACPRLPPDFVKVAVVNPPALKALEDYTDVQPA